MNIFRSGPNSTSASNPSSGIAPQAATPAPSSSTEQNGTSDEVRLSHMLGSLISALQGSPARMPEQAKKISALSAAVASGRYRVDPYVVSGSIIQHSIRYGGTSYLAPGT